MGACAANVAGAQRRRSQFSGAPRGGGTIPIRTNPNNKKIMFTPKSALFTFFTACALGVVACQPVDVATSTAAPAEAGDPPAPAVETAKAAADR